jgi:uncharacterized protein
MRLLILLALAVASAAAVTGKAPAQDYSQLDSARRSGQVGERYDGYLGFVTGPTPQLQRQVSAINIRRRSLYVGLARRRNVTPEIAGFATACELLRNVAVGEFYMLQDRIWRRRLPGQPTPRPSYCG